MPHDSRVTTGHWVVLALLISVVLAAVLTIESLRAILAKPPTPVIRPDGVPANPTRQVAARFTFTDAKPVVFECALDRSPYVVCGSGRLASTRYRGPLSPGVHVFRVRARSGSRTSGSATYAWVVLAEPAGGSITLGPAMPVEISGRVSQVVPGVTKAIPVTFRNPSEAQIRVTSLTVKLSRDSVPPGCPSAANLVLGQATGITAAAPVTVPARGNATVAVYPRAPRITFRDLATSQDACKGKSFRLTFTGRAHG
jgi:hypothetical protein